MEDYIFTEHRIRMDFSRLLEKTPVSGHDLNKYCGINGAAALSHYTGRLADPASPSTRTRLFFDNISALCRLLDCSPWDAVTDYYRPYEGPENTKPFRRYEPTEEERALRLRGSDTLIFRLPIKPEVHRIREYVLKWHLNYFSAMGLVFGTNIISSSILDVTLTRDNYMLKDCLAVIDKDEFEKKQDEFDPRRKKAKKLTAVNGLPGPSRGQKYRLVWNGQEEEHTLREWGQICGINEGTLRQRMLAGCAPEELLLPLKRSRNRTGKPQSGSDQ